MTNFFETEEVLKETQIIKLEERLKFNFPSEYIKHILQFNGGRCEPNLFSFKERGNLTQSSVDWFLALYGGEYNSLEDYFITCKLDEKRMPNSIFPIAHDPGGNLICMDANDSKIYFWDHEKEVDYRYSDDSDWSNLYLIAENLNEFISALNSEFI